MRAPWVSKAFGRSFARFDPSKHPRQGGKFAPTGGAAPPPVSRPNHLLDEAFAEPPRQAPKAPGGDIRGGGPDIFGDAGPEMRPGPSKPKRGSRGADPRLSPPARPPAAQPQGDDWMNSPSWRQGTSIPPVPKKPTGGSVGAQQAEGRDWLDQKVGNRPSATPPPLPPGYRQPPTLPHQRTQVAALEHARNVRPGDHASHQRAVQALDAHYKEGLATLRRMAGSRVGGKAHRAAAEQFRAKIGAARGKIDQIAGKGPPPVPRRPGQGPPPLADRGRVRPWVSMKALDLSLPLVMKSHDVSGEARDEGGRWTVGSAAGHKDNYRALLAQAKEARKAAHAHAMSGARESHESANKAQDALHDAHTNLQWDSDEHDAYNELDEVVVSYDPDAPLSERMNYFKDVTTAAQAALKEELSFDDADEAETKKITAENHAHLKTILSHAKAAREHLRRHAAARREAASIKSGDWLEKCIQRLMTTAGRPWIVKMRDSSGHEHASDGRFGTVAGTHGGKKPAGKPKKAGGMPVAASSTGDLTTRFKPGQGESALESLREGLSHAFKDGPLYNDEGDSLVPLNLFVALVKRKHPDASTHDIYAALKHLHDSRKIQLHGLNEQQLLGSTDGKIAAVDGNTDKAHATLWDGGKALHFVEARASKSAHPYLTKSRDASGHEHAADGRFGSGGSHAAKPAPATRKPTGYDRKPPKGTDHTAKAESKAKTLAKRISEVPQQLRHQVTSFVRGRYRRLAKRYGPKAAYAIIGAAILLLPMPVPGSSLIPIAVAEVVLALKRAVQKGHEADLTPEQIKTEARKLVRELYAACGEEMPK